MNMYSIRRLMIFSMLMVFGNIVNPAQVIADGFVRSVSGPQIRSLKPQNDDQTLFRKFEGDLDTIRQVLNIPGMSAAIVRDQELVWASGFGYANMENQVPATPETPYGLASVTKPVAAVLIMQLVEGGLVDLDAPVTRYGVQLENDAITVRHLLTHTSEGTLGEKFLYNGSRYAYLGGVMVGASGQTYADLLSQRILLPLGMDDTALNPISNWGGPVLTGSGDFKLALGWGINFRHYPDVYTRLAQPYQLDDQFNIIPGMYHLHHNPGAGLISSVVDLAKFDIALDQGLLLNEHTQAEMFKPAYITYENRDDLMYGLGWYIQEFDGLQLRWHTGRWAPSTSALYLKIPEEDLTFIVLANTDNLTVPFYGVGCGDVSKSLLVLSFFRHFIFADKYGTELPEIDWEAPEGRIVDQLSIIQDENINGYLERELWSYRQAYASIRQISQVEKLKRVNFRAFPNSEMRRDELFTNLPGQYPVIPPTVPAKVYVWLSVGIIIWFFISFISSVGLAFHLIRTKQLFQLQSLNWLLGTLLLGPISIGIYTLNRPNPRFKEKVYWRQAWSASLLIVTGYTLAWIIAITFLKKMHNDPHPLVILLVTYMTPLLVSLLFFRIPLTGRQVNIGFWKLAGQSVLSEVISLNLGYSVLFPITVLSNQRLFTTIPHPTSPYFWGMISFIAALGILILFPLHYCLILRGFTIPSGRLPGDNKDLNLPSLKTAWFSFISTTVIMIVILALTIYKMS